jgi:hypothetical protein
MGLNGKSRRSRSHVLFKPRGVIHPRVKAVGPEHFAMLCIDCAKNRSKIGCANSFWHSVGGRPVKIPVVAVRQTT